MNDEMARKRITFEMTKKIIGNKVYCNVTSLVEELLKLETPILGFSYDDIENLYVPTCTECSHTNISAEDGDWCPVCNKVDEDGELIESDDNIHGVYSFEEPQEIFEWYRISETLYSALQSIGDPVIDSDEGYYWGRTCTGQSIYMDGTIQEAMSKYWGNEDN